MFRGSLEGSPTIEGHGQPAARRPGRAIWLGALLIFTGLSVNKWSVEQTLIPDRRLEGTINVLIITGFQILLLLAGLWVIWRKPNLSSSSLFRAAVAVLAALIVVGGYGSASALVPPRWQARGIPMVERLEMIARDTSMYKLESERRTLLYKARMAGEKLRALLGMRRALDLRLNEANYLLQKGSTEAAIEELDGIKRVADALNHVPPNLLTSVRDLLAIAYLRLGEQQNCIVRHSPYACYLPLPPSGIHRLEFGSRAAIAEFASALRENPDDLSSRWLLNIAYMTLGEYPERVPREWLIPEEAFRSDYDIKRFADVAPDLGLDLLGHAGGSIVEDFDGDGNLDVMVSSTGLSDQLRYFRNNGEGTFTERTTEAGLQGQLGGLNIIHADYNNDGYPDVLVTRGGWMTFDSGEGNHPDSLLRNDGHGRFTDVTEKAGLLRFHPNQAAAWGDYDNDGWVDLFLGNESWENQTHPPELFHNNGDGTFSDRAASVGITSAGYIKGAAWGDYNNDGLLDLYVSVIGKPNILYRNDGERSGRWSFTDVTLEAGVAEPVYSFATWFWDYDNDGWLDLFVAGFGGSYSGMSFSFDDTGAVRHAVEDDLAASYLGLPVRFAEFPRLYRNNHDGTFTDVTQRARLDRVLHVMGANFGDLDNDGFPDAYLGTGTASYRSLMPNRMFRSADGAFFQDVTTSGGFGHLQKGHAVAFGDIDNDGDQDIYADIGAWYEGDVFQNVLFENPGHGNHWITLRLEGVRSNRLAIGTRIRVTVRAGGSERDIYATVSTGGSFGASSLQQEIGLGGAESISRIEVTWPASREVQVFRDVPMDRILKIREGNPDLVPVPSQPFDLLPKSGHPATDGHSGHRR